MALRAANSAGRHLAAKATESDRARRARIDEARSAYAAGEEIVDIARALKRSRQLIHRWVSDPRYGLPVRREE